MNEKLYPPAQIQPAHPGLEALEDGYFSLDAAWRVTYWNTAAERMLRIPRAKMLGEVLWERLPELRGSVLWEGLHSARHSGVAIRFALPHPSAESRALLSVRAVSIPEGGLVVHFRDATAEIRRAEQYSMLLESMRDGLIAVDADCNITYLNAAAESLLRLRRDRALGICLWPLLPSRPVELVECLRATLADGLQRHLRDVRPEGRVFRGRVFDLWTDALPDGGLSLLFEDVSERVQREKELARLAAEAQDANRAKGRFFAAISHELRTPLNAIIGYTHLLSTKTYGEMPEAALRAADRAGVCAEHLSRLVDDVLLLTTSEIGRLPVVPADVELAEFLPSVVELFRHQAEAKGLRFEMELEDALPVLETDTQRLRQLLSALLSNAVKFTSRGEVRLMVARGPAEGPAATEQAHGIEFRVSDTGPGVDSENRERIFGPFERLGDPARSDSMLHGSGLGLTVATQLSTLLQGRLFLEETSPAGSCFCLRLPVALSARPG